MSDLTIQNLTVQFDGLDAVRDVSLSVREGELVSLLGPSGCGKSTILKVVAGLLEPTDGRVRVGEVMVNDPASSVFVPPERRDLGMVFQSYAIWPHMNVFENVAYPLKVRGIPKSEIADRVRQALAMVDLAPVALRPSTDLSGGQQQRVAIARSLVFEPKLLLMDEPLSNLDTKLRLRMGLELKRIQERTGVTTVYVTHDQGEALALSDKIAVLKQGRIQQVGTPAEIYEAPKSSFVGWFIGSSNFIPGRITGVVGDRARVALDGAGLELDTIAPPSASPGDDVVICARPEHIVLSDAGNADAVEVEVVTSAYLGERHQCSASLNGNMIEFFAPPDAQIERGSRCLVTFALGRSTAFLRADHAAHFGDLNDEPAHVPL